MLSLSTRNVTVQIEITDMADIICTHVFFFFFDKSVVHVHMFYSVDKTHWAKRWSHKSRFRDHNYLFIYFNSLFQYTCEIIYIDFVKPTYPISIIRKCAQKNQSHQQLPLA
jgi:hypothetical protein